MGERWPGPSERQASGPAGKLQIVMGWEDDHLHEFKIGRRLYSVHDPDDDMYERKVIDERRVPLGQVVPRSRC